VSRRSKLGLALLALLGFVRGSGRRPRRERIVPEEEGNPRAETAVALLLLGATASAVMFIVIYALDWHNSTQWLSLSLGSALAMLGAALIVTGKQLVPEEEVEEEYPIDHAGEQQRVIQIFEESGSGLTRRRLLLGAAGAAGAALGAALVIPAASFGPVLDTKSLYYSPWHRDLRLVDEDGRPYLADDISTDAFYTAYPEDVDREQLAAPLVVVRVDPGELELPPERRNWAPEGILAFSKICPHAGCAISLYRKPTFAPAEPRRALVCPCHYSTFDPAQGGTVIFGPAGRELPQLPLLIDSKGELRAAANFSAPVGPSFWGIRTRRPSA
jgi:ubiquinol-cytochrome c reductase iron-sulfur subunit